MIATILIALGRRARVGIDVRLDHFGRADFAIVDLLRPAAIDGGGAWYGGRSAPPIGGIAATTVIVSLFGLPYCMAFAMMNALPAWWLAHLVLLAPDNPLP